jgi:DNA processing protein
MTAPPLPWDREELSAWLRLSLTPGVGNGTARRLLSHFGPPQLLFAQPESALRRCVSAAQARALSSLPDDLAVQLETTWQWLHPEVAQAPARAVIALGDARYPPTLLQTEDPPLLLYLMGAERWLRPEQPFAAVHSLAVVGSRNPTAQGADNARQFARALQAMGFSIVSGLALGVDAAAHEGALDNVDSPAAAEALQAPATIAVVGTGLDRVYPRQNLDLARRIALHGLLVSEYPLGTPPLPANFPKRNRIISGLSQGTLVVEAALASGSLITARMASEQGREVFAIPGSIHAPQSRGCHALIRQGAKLVESAQDILEELQWPGAAAVVVRPASSTPAQEASDGDGAEGLPLPGGTVGDEGPLLRALGYDPMGLDALVARTGMDAAMLQVELLELELAGRVARLPGGLFQRLGHA